MDALGDGTVGARRLAEIERALRARAADLAVYLVFDRPSLVADRPGLSRTFFAERCASDEQIEEMTEALRAVGVRVEVFEGDQQFLAALVEGRAAASDKALQVAYNGLGYSVGEGAFQRGRKSLIPLIADSYGVLCANSDAYTCALAMHKFHSFTLLRTLGVEVPRTWQYQIDRGWNGGAPPPGTKVIAKSSYESWAIGVSDMSVFYVDDSSPERLSEIAESIGQAVTVQEFVSGREVYVPVLSCPELIAGSPVESVLSRAPKDADAFVTLADNLADDAISYRRFDGDDLLIGRLQDSAKRNFSLLEMEGLGRIDFRIDADGCPWVFDVAISPGLDREGSGATSLEAYGFDYPAFIRLVFAATLATKGTLTA